MTMPQTRHSKLRGRLATLGTVLASRIGFPQAAAWAVWDVRIGSRGIHVCLVTRNRAWSFDVDQVDTRRSANGEREGRCVAISAASPATDFTLATRRAALSRLVESARALVLMLALRIHAGGAEQQYRHWRLTKTPRTIGGFERPLRFAGEKFRPAKSSDKPILNAFCRVAPTVRFNVLAIFAACVFFRASAFNVRTCAGVHSRRFDTFLAIK